MKGIITRAVVQDRGKKWSIWSSDKFLDTHNYRERIKNLRINVPQLRPIPLAVIYLSQTLENKKINDFKRFTEVSVARKPIP